MTLYDIKEEILKAAQNVRVDEETGEVIGFEELDALNEAFDEKVESCAVYYKGMLADIAAFKAEELALKDRRARLEKKAENFKNYIDRNMAEAGRDKFETAKCAIKYRKSEAVEITDDTLLPEEYKAVKTEWKPDKDAIKRAIKAGESVPGAAIVEKQNIQIK